MASKIVKLRNIKRALKVNPASVANQAIKYIVGGRVDNFRVYKAFNFIDLIDGSTEDHLQVIIPKDLLKKPELGSYLVCQGNIVSSRGSQQAIEFKVNGLDFVGPCNPDTYILAQAKDKLTDGLYRQHMHIRPRVNQFRSLLRVRSELELSLHMIFKQMDFFRVHTPTLTANDSEASSDLFMVQRSKSASTQTNPAARADEEDSSYFQNKDVFMITSAQLHLECLAASLSRVYCLAPCFRAENSITRRHLCEFQMLEAEESNLDQLEPLMSRVESIIKFSAQFLSQVSEYNNDFSSLLERNSNQENFEKLAHSNYIRMTYEEAVQILSKKGGGGAADKSIDTSQSGPPLATSHHDGICSVLKYGQDLTRLHERQLLEFCNNVPIFITNYPKQLKPFYMKCDEQNKLAQCFDLIAPIGGEICGGSLREDDLDKLLANMQLNLNSSSSSSSAPNHHHQPPQPKNWLGNIAQSEQSGTRGGRGAAAAEGHQKFSNFDWYLDLRRLGSFPHGGFGIGFERLIQAMLGVRNIKDTLAFPRWSGHCPM